jgi:rhodanese-related sulfurtransferase
MSRIDLVLTAARRRYRRLTAAEVPDALRRGAVLVDIRPQAQRKHEGVVPGALVVERNVLEWRCDPTSDARLPEASGDDVEWVIFCSEGFTSSLAVAALLDIGLHRATDIVGGYRTLAGAGVLYTPVERSSGRSLVVLSGVQPGGDSTAAQPSATSAT